MFLNISSFCSLTKKAQMYVVRTLIRCLLRFDDQTFLVNTFSLHLYHL